MGLRIVHESAVRTLAGAVEVADERSELSGVQTCCDGGDAVLRAARGPGRSDSRIDRTGVQRVRPRRQAFGPRLPADVPGPLRAARCRIRRSSSSGSSNRRSHPQLRGGDRVGGTSLARRARTSTGPTAGESSCPSRWLSATPPARVIPRRDQSRRRSHQPRRAHVGGISVRHRCSAPCSTRCAQSRGPASAVVAHGHGGGCTADLCRPHGLGTSCCAPAGPASDMVRRGARAGIQPQPVTPGDTACDSSGRLDAGLPSSAVQRPGFRRWPDVCSGIPTCSTRRGGCRSGSTTVRTTRRRASSIGHAREERLPRPRPRVLHRGRGRPPATGHSSQAHAPTRVARARCSAT